MIHRDNNLYPSTDEQRLHLKGIDAAGSYIDKVEHRNETRQIVGIVLLVVGLLLVQIIRGQL